MWVIFKIKKNEKALFKKDLLSKLDEQLVFYSPKILTKKPFKNKTVNNAVDILGDYIFVNHASFKNSDFKYTEPFESLFTQGMVCHETYKNEDNKWLYPDEIEKNSEGNFVTKKK